MFRVNQKVVCVDDERTDATGVKDVHRGEIYTIRWCGIHSTPWHPEEYCVRLLGIERVDSWVPSNIDCPFRASRFRPIVERKTDISVFTAMLNPSARKVEA